MDFLDENECSRSEQIFNLQLDLEKHLKSIDYENNAIDGQSAVFGYFDHILDNKLVTIDDFGDGVQWLNVSESISLNSHLKGLILVIDFFTYCCVNCLHILPKLKSIEDHFESQSVVVIGVHSPKFENEKDITNVCDSLLKYNITHPIANDPTAKVWTTLGIHCWPTLLILGPNSELLFTLIGETGAQQWLQFYTESALKYFGQKNLLITENKSKLPLKLLKNTFHSKLLAFPAKISASVDQQLIAVSNSRHNNIIIATNNGIIKHIIGSNESGFRDGSFSTAQFNGPNGVVWKDNNIVFVADTGNHSIRMIDINGQSVVTIAGNGKQSDDLIGGSIGCEQELNSPWDLCVHNNQLFIAMAGCHQIWVFTLEDDTQVLNKLYPKGCCFCFAGDGAEQNRNNRYPHKASFAQPSGLALNAKNNCIYIADSESSSVRAIDILNGCVSAIVGGDRNPQNLFAFGDSDGKAFECRLQHCMAIAFDASNDCLFVADSYNHKVKKINLSTKECITIAGTGIKGHRSDCMISDCAFNEPNGLCLINDSKTLLITDTNNHCIKTLNLETDFITELKLIEIKEKLKTDLKTHSKYLKPDFTIRLNSIDFSLNSELKLRLALDFGQQIKATKDTKHSIVFLNPDQTIFTTTHADMKFENFEQISEFSLKLRDNENIEILNSVYDFIIDANFNLCNLELNFCKQIKVEFHLPLVLSDKQIQVLTIDLPFTLNSL